MTSTPGSTPRGFLQHARDAVRGTLSPGSEALTGRTIRSATTTNGGYSVHAALETSNGLEEDVSRVHPFTGSWKSEPKSRESSSQSSSSHSDALRAPVSNIPHSDSTSASFESGGLRVTEEARDHGLSEGSERDGVDSASNRIGSGVRRGSSSSSLTSSSESSLHVSRRVAETAPERSRIAKKGEAGFSSPLGAYLAHLENEVANEGTSSLRSGGRPSYVAPSGARNRRSSRSNTTSSISSSSHSSNTPWLNRSSGAPFAPTGSSSGASAESSSMPTSGGGVSLEDASEGVSGVAAAREVWDPVYDPRLGLEVRRRRGGGLESEESNGGAIAPSHARRLARQSEALYWSLRSYESGVVSSGKSGKGETRSRMRRDRLLHSLASNPHAVRAGKPPTPLDLALAVSGNPLLYRGRLGEGPGPIPAPFSDAHAAMGLLGERVHEHRSAVRSRPGDVSNLQSNPIPTSPLGHLYGNSASRPEKPLPAATVRAILEETAKAAGTTDVADLPARVQALAFAALQIPALDAFAAQTAAIVDAPQGRDGPALSATIEQLRTLIQELHLLRKRVRDLERNSRDPEVQRARSGYRYPPQTEQPSTHQEATRRAQEIANDILNRF